jgi:hypothetical protein
LLIVLSYPFYWALVNRTADPVVLFVLAAVVFSLASGTWPFQVVQIRTTV